MKEIFAAKMNFNSVRIHFGNCISLSEYTFAGYVLDTFKNASQLSEISRNNSPM